jgi:hypothetical protein
LEQGVEESDAVLGGGGQVGTDRAELGRAGQGPQAARYLLPHLDHPDLAFGWIVVERHSWILGEPQVVVVPVDQSMDSGRNTATNQTVALHWDGTVWTASPTSLAPAATGGTISPP